MASLRDAFRSGGKGILMLKKELQPTAIVCMSRGREASQGTGGVRWGGRGETMANAGKWEGTGRNLVLFTVTSRCLEGGWDTVGTPLIRVQRTK